MTPVFRNCRPTDDKESRRTKTYQRRTEAVISRKSVKERLGRPTNVSHIPDFKATDGTTEVRSAGGLAQQ